MLFSLKHEINFTSITHEINFHPSSNYLRSGNSDRNFTLDPVQK
jgi:hypothetical protein